ncbi:hypothetical protein [Flavisphingomonas formosensis]|uniref:hypothetical protein n=1 Tax=Flavisphingomonas formosensis TaxID=861534 RepID=UPI0012FB206F|nr:hypothetical protein [Sphingomonas formosensis]
MFIDVTRYGGMRTLRLAVAAIAYLDAVEGGSSVHLIGSERLRVNESPDEIEALIAAAAPKTQALEPIAVEKIPAMPAVAPGARDGRQRRR